MSLIEEALDAARKTKGNTLLVPVSPRQTERLYLAMQIADLLMAVPPRRSGKIGELVARYRELLSS